MSSVLGTLLEGFEDFDEAKHPRGFHGHWITVGGVEKKVADLGRGESLELPHGISVARHRVSGKFAVHAPGRLPEKGLSASSASLRAYEQHRRAEKLKAGLAMIHRNTAHQIARDAAQESVVPGSLLGGGGKCVVRKVNVLESGQLAALLEGFSADAGPVVLDGRMRPGDRVRVDVKGAESIVGRMVRPSDRKPATHVLVAPEGGGPHVEAPVKSVRHDTPEQQAAERARREAEREAERQVLAPPPGERPAPPGASPAVQTERGLRSMAKGSARLQPEAQRQRERNGGRVAEGVGLLLEGFNVGYSAPPSAGAGGGAAPRMPRGSGSVSAPSETPAQSRARAAGMVAQARKGITDFNAKHPRGGHGRFSKKGGATSSTGKRATRATPGGARILTMGTKGTLVRSIQRQLHLPATGTFDARTQAAIERYQRQHGLLVDGRVGAQTIASLRGNPNASKIKPGPIPYKAARVANPHKRRSRAKAPPAPVRLGTGVVV